MGAAHSEYPDRRRRLISDGIHLASKIEKTMQISMDLSGTQDKKKKIT